MTKTLPRGGHAVLETETAIPYAFERVQRDSGGGEVARLEAQNLLLEKSGPMDQIPPTPADGAILDVGSGAGFWSLRLAARIPQGQFTCLDRSPELLELARQRLEGAVSCPVDYLRQDLRDLNLPARSFDLAFTCVTLAHVQELGQTLARIAAALKPGGWVACFEPIQQSRRFSEVHPDCPNLSFLMDRMTEEAADRGSDLAVSLKIAHHLERLGMEATTLKDYGAALHGADAAFCIRDVFLPLARTYLQQSLDRAHLEERLEAAAREALLPHLWMDFRRAVVLARKPNPQS